MKYIILGLLLHKNLTVYEMIVIIKNFMESICSASTGSIKSAINLLVKEKAITFHEETKNNRNKKIYTITDIGISEFNNWLELPMQTGKSKNMELGKLFFLGLSDEGIAKEGIRNYIEQLAYDYQKLEQIKNSQEIKEQLKTIGKTRIQDISAKDQLDMSIKYQLITLKYGMDMLAFEIDWYKRLYTEMEESEDE